MALVTPLLLVMLEISCSKLVLKMVSHLTSG